VTDDHSQSAPLEHLP